MLKPICSWSVTRSVLSSVRLMSDSLAPKKLVIYEYGDPAKVVKLENDELHKPKKNEVLVKMLVASMNPADMNSVQGTYPIKPQSGQSPGFEGVALVEEVGDGVSNLRAGDTVIPNIEAFGTWRTHATVPQDHLLKIPSDVPLVEVSGISSNVSTAYRLLNDFVQLNPGDTVIQNGGNSAAGQNVIQLCKAFGYTSVSIVRDRPDIDSLKEYLKVLGADHVLTEQELRTTDMFKSGEVKAPRLGLNSIGGKNCTEVARHLGSGGVLVTYGGMSKEPVTIPTSAFIFKDIILRGFWMTRWTKKNRDSEERTAMLAKLLNLMREGNLKAPNHSLIKLDDYQSALEAMTKPAGFAGVKYIIDFREF